MSEPVAGTFTDNTQSNTFKPTGGGLVTADLVRIAGSMNVALQTSLDAGSNWTNVYDRDGVEQSVSMSSNRTHARLSLIAFAGQLFRLVSSNNSSGNVQYHITRTIWK